MILIVDDEPSALLMLELVLQRSNYIVRKARSGKEALRLLEDDVDGTCSLVITDIRMPVMDGRGLLANLRANPRLASIPVVMCTSTTDRSTVLEMIGNGVRDYIVKPFKAAMVMAKIQGLLANEEPVIEQRFDTLARLDIANLEYEPLANATVPTLDAIAEDLAVAVRESDAKKVRWSAQRVNEPASLFGGNRAITAAQCVAMASDDVEAFRLAGVLAAEIGELRSALQRAGLARLA
jgi:DNA-binding response OmpR family regulator